MSNFSGTGKTIFKNKNIPILGVSENFRNMKEVSK